MLRATNESLKFTHTTHAVRPHTTPHPVSPWVHRLALEFHGSGAMCQQSKCVLTLEPLIEALSPEDYLARNLLASNNDVDCLGFSAVHTPVPPGGGHRHCFFLLLLFKTFPTHQTRRLLLSCLQVQESQKIHVHKNQSSNGLTK